MDDTENDQSLTLTNSLGIETYKEGQLREGGLHFFTQVTLVLF